MAAPAQGVAVEPPEPILNVEVDFLSGDPRCTCDEANREHTRKSISGLQGYIGVRPGQGVRAAWLELRGVALDDYMERARRLYKGAIVRNIRKAERLGYRCHPFPYALHVPDIHAIHFSKPVRSGGRMRANYRRSIEELGGAPTGPVELRPVPCPLHYELCWGGFLPADGHVQGAVRTDERLAAYVLLHRLGDVAFYPIIMGHGADLPSGIMFLLHRSILAWLLDPANPCGAGLNHLFYAGFFDGGHGLQLWKKKALFRPARLFAPRPWR